MTRPCIESLRFGNLDLHLLDQVPHQTVHDGTPVRFKVHLSKFGFLEDSQLKGPVNSFAVSLSCNHYFINVLSTFYQLFINFFLTTLYQLLYQLVLSTCLSNCFINFLSTVYQLFINYCLSTFYQLVYQLFINFLSTCFINFISTFFINFFSTFYQLSINFLSTCFINFLSTFYQFLPTGSEERQYPQDHVQQERQPD